MTLAGIRLLTARLADGRRLELVATRPPEETEHGTERVSAAMCEADGSARPFARTLLSTEYDAGGAPRRIGLELWPQEGVPRRGAGVRTACERFEPGDGWVGYVAKLRVSIDGVEGSGRYSLVLRENHRR